MHGDSELDRIDEEILRLETRRAEVEAKIKLERSAFQQHQLYQHLTSVDRTLKALRRQKQRTYGVA